MPGNPFKKDDKGEGGLLSTVLRSDQWDDQDLEQPAGAAAGPVPTAAEDKGAAAAAAPPPAAFDAAQRSAAPAYTAAEAPLPPPPPPVATASFIPPPLATQPPTVTGVPASTAGAWGAAQPAQQPGVWGVSSSQYDSGPAGYPPGYGGYGAPGGAPYGAPGGAPGYQAQQWTGGPSDQPLTYTTFEQSAGGQQQPLGCYGWGEQWACFIIGILIWPLWYVGVCWYVFSKTQSSDPREPLSF
ncbi:hypothetical protein C2E21_9479 [Chlorella sorokiniana]|uniref:Uncharacterized protein n=1 Tax=Chlorella sorokiniana TaxID=3076 RepID=A0A2P6TB87_CHLSO|nr:hypothetical protein C2E21_9479 [Chlorella sorokiniana]|eukprot:PRW05809.1 hypothetical protein C2E21_9479 [Chlorella sorokiniana]